MEEEGKDIQQDVVDPARLVKKVRKSRKVRQSRRKQSILRKAVRFLMTVLMLFLLVYITKLPQWYLPQNAYTTANNEIIKIENNHIVKSYRILALMKLHEVSDKPIYMMKTNDIEKDIKTLKPIEDVYIRRYAFPARLHIIVKERTPVISICLGEKAPAIAAFTTDGTLIGKEFMPLSPDIKTIKVIASDKGHFSYTKWNLDNINEIIKIISYIESYSKEPVEYIDMRNPADVYVKVKTVNIRIGKLDSNVYERIKRIPSILPRIKFMKSKVQYLDISWEKVNYLKLYK
ncbi:FtsQ-type POTRA domain-containing protein [bacterium]|nr:FtsQ-type POTRA domain-containing protein [bacterium]